jgi:hypothetical protein
LNAEINFENGHCSGTRGVVQVKKLSRLLQPDKDDILNYEFLRGFFDLFRGMGAL